MEEVKIEDKNDIIGIINEVQVNQDGSQYNDDNEKTILEDFYELLNFVTN